MSEPDWPNGLPTRSRNTMLAYRVSEDQARDIFASREKTDEFVRSAYNFSNKGAQDVREFLGIPEPAPLKMTVKGVVLRWRAGDISADQAMAEISEMHGH